MRESKTRVCFTRLSTASNVNAAGHAATWEVCGKYYSSESWGRPSENRERWIRVLVCFLSLPGNNLTTGTVNCPHFLLSCCDLPRRQTRPRTSAVLWFTLSIRDAGNVPKSGPEESVHRTRPSLCGSPGGWTTAQPSPRGRLRLQWHQKTRQWGWCPTTLPVTSGHLQCRRPGCDPWVGTVPRGGHGNPLQCSCLENPMDRGAWRATVHGVTESRTRLNEDAQQVVED